MFIIRKPFAVLSIFLLLTAFSSGCDSKDSKKKDPASSPKKNVIIMISDGCGYNQILAANYYTGVAKQSYEDFPVKYAMSTYEYAQSYETAKAWSDFNYVSGFSTDSASAATAMSTGIKTVNGNIGYSSDDSIALKHAFEYAEENGYSTGVVTSVEFSHATPAGFIAHNVNRNNYADIAQEMINSSATDVIMGAGHPLYDNDGMPRSTGQDYKYVGGQSVWDALVAGTAGNTVDANKDGVIDSKDCWTLIQTKAEFEAYADNSSPAAERVCGVAQVYTTLQQARAGSALTVNGDPFISTVPALPVMAKAALNILNKNDKGFVLMIEGGAIDWAGHANQSNRIIEEESDFNNAVTAVISWVEKNSSWEETLLIVTGDHETGYLSGPGSTAPATWIDIVNNGAGVMPGMAFFSANHTNSLIPFFAKGFNADLFDNEIAGTDTVRGKYIDNTSIGKILTEIYK